MKCAAGFVARGFQRVKFRASAATASTALDAARA